MYNFNMNYEFLKKQNFDVDGAIERFAGKSELFEKSFDYQTLVNLAVENVKTITIDTESDLDLSFLGLEVRNVL